MPNMKIPLHIAGLDLSYRLLRGVTGNEYRRDFGQRSTSPRKRGDAGWNPAGALLAIVLASCASQTPLSPVEANRDPCGEPRAQTAASREGHATSQPCAPVTPPKASNPLGTLFAWAVPRDHKWRKEVVTVRFLNGTERLQRETWACFQEWDCILPGLSFQLVAPGEPADIRVNFDFGEGHWSYLGRDALTIAEPERTMQLGFAWDEFRDEIQRVARHEIGHAIGLQHEHQHPAADFEWTPAAMEFYRRTQGWSADEVRRQVLAREAPDGWEGTAYDPGSIMEYPIPPGTATRNGKPFEVGWNREISPLDRSFTISLYPSH